MLRYQFTLLSFIVLIFLVSGALHSQPAGAVKELVEKRTATSKHWQNADGSMTAEIFLRPVHFQDSDGLLKDIDTRIGPFAKANYAHSVVKNLFRSHLAAGAKGWQTLESGPLVFSFAADSANDSAGTVTGSSITYPDAWPFVDMKYTILPTEIKEELVLKAKPSISTFRFIIKPGNLRPVTVGKGIKFVDSYGKTHVNIPAPFMYDAKQKRSNAVEISWRTLEGGSVELALTADAKWLSSATYPVVIDPTVGITPWMEGIEGYYHKPSYETTYTWWDIWTPGFSSLNCGTGGWSDGELGNYHACCLWYMVGIVPTNATVISASITIQALNPCDDCGPGLIYFRDITEPVSWTSPTPWQPDRLPYTGNSHQEWFETYSVRDPNTYELVGVANTYNAQWVKNLVQSWVTTPSTNNGLMFENTDTVTPRLYELASHNSYSGTEPTLVVQYVADNTPPSMLAVNDGITPGEDKDYTTDTALMEATWSASDPESGVAEYQYAIGTTVGGTDVVGWTSVGSATSVTKTGLNLTPGNTYYFTVKAKNGAELWSSNKSSDGITVAEEFYTYTYDSNGNKTVTNANGTKTIYTYDERYRLRQVKHLKADNTLIQNATTNYTVDGVGNRTEVWFDENTSNKTTYGYDAMNRLWKVNGVETYTYDWVGNRLSDGVNTYSYDAADRLLPLTKYTYYGTGSLKQVYENGVLKYTYDYDPRELLESVMYHSGQ